jgi:beta-lactamase class C
MSGLQKTGRFGRWFAPVGLALGAGLAATLAISGLTSGGSEQQTASATNALPAARAPAALPSKVDYRRLDARIARLMSDPDMVGLAVGTVERGDIRFVRGYGETLAGSGAPVTPETVFRWASVSKGVASALVVKLAAEGRLSLNAPLASLGTTLTLPGDAGAVTVADLLSHRLGLVRNAWDERLESGEDPKLLRAALGTLDPYCPPATCYGYQNIAFDAASEIVERTTGQSYASVARERLFAPLGMTSASLDRAGLEGAASRGHPHRRGRVPVAVNDNYYRVPAAGGVNSSILDLLRWMRAQMGGAPEVLSREMLHTMHRPRVSTPPRGRRGPMDRALTNAAYGLGWRSFTYAGHALVGHRGSVDGYGSLILFDPVDKSGIVMLWNSNQPRAARLQLEFFDMLYGLPPTDWLGLDASPGAESALPPDGLPPTRENARSAADPARSSPH